MSRSRLLLRDEFSVLLISPDAISGVARNVRGMRAQCFPLLECLLDT